MDWGGSGWKIFFQGIFQLSQKQIIHNSVSKIEGKHFEKKGLPDLCTLTISSHPYFFFFNTGSPTASWDSPLELLETLHEASESHCQEFLKVLRVDRHYINYLKMYV